MISTEVVSSKCGFPHQTHTVSWSLPLWTPILHPPLHVPHQLWPPIFTTTSYLIPPLEPVPSSFSHVPLSLRSQRTTHARYISFPYKIFECRHNIRNQPVSTTILSPSSFATSLRSGNIGILVRFLNTFFLVFFKTVSHTAKHSTGTPSIGFHSYSQELVYMCSCYNFVCPLFKQDF